MAATVARAPAGSGEPLNDYGVSFRDYATQATPRQRQVERFYAEQHAKQTLEFAVAEKQRYARLDTCTMTVWQAGARRTSLREA